MSTAFPIFLYNPTCSICPTVLLKCCEYFNQKGIQLLIRKPYPDEAKRLPGTPALYIPSEIFNTEAPVVFVGSQIPDWLQDLQLQINVKP